MEKLKKHLKEHKIIYISIGGSAVIAVITCVIMKRQILQPISRDIDVTAKRGIAVLGKRVVMNDVSYFSSNRQGPPSWVIRCLETGGIFESQNAASLGMNLSKSEISQHLNGIRDHVRGYHFERICMAAT